MSLFYFAKIKKMSVLVFLFCSWSFKLHYLKSYFRSFILPSTLYVTQLAFFRSLSHSDSPPLRVSLDSAIGSGALRLFLQLGTRRALVGWLHSDVTRPPFHSGLPARIHGAEAPG